MASKYNQFEKLQREIGVSIALSDIEKQLECLKGKDQQALSSEFEEWISEAKNVIVSLSRDLRSTTSFSLSGGIKETIRNEILKSKNDTNSQGLDKSLNKND